MSSSDPEKVPGSPGGPGGPGGPCIPLSLYLPVEKTKLISNLGFPFYYNLSSARLLLR